MNVISASTASASNLLKAMANETRLIILCGLVDGERSVGEMEAELGIRQPTLSQQLAYLREKRLVSTRRDSKRIFYRLASEEAKRMIGVLSEMYPQRT